MIAVDKNILISSPDDLIGPIIKFIENNWDGSGNVSCKADRDVFVSPVQTLVKDIFFQGWAQAINHYPAKTLQSINAAIAHLNDRAAASDYRLRQLDLLPSPCEDEVTTSCGRSLPALESLLARVGRKRLAKNLGTPFSIDAVHLATNGLVRRYSGAGQLRPKGFYEWHNRNWTEISLLDALSEDPFTKWIDGFAGYDHVSEGSGASLPQLLCTPFVAWEMAGRSVLPLEHLVSSIMNYGYSLRCEYNHHSVLDQVRSCTSNRAGDEPAP